MWQRDGCCVGLLLQPGHFRAPGRPGDASRADAWRGRLCGSHRVLGGAGARVGDAHAADAAGGRERIYRAAHHLVQDAGERRAHGGQSREPDGRLGGHLGGQGGQGRRRSRARHAEPWQGADDRACAAPPHLSLCDRRELQRGALRCAAGVHAGDPRDAVRPRAGRAAERGRGRLRPAARQPRRYHHL